MSKMSSMEVARICGVKTATVSRWIRQGYLKAEKDEARPGRYGGGYVIEESDLRAFVMSDNYAGHPEDIFASRAFNRTPLLEECYPINLLISCLNIPIESEEVAPDIWKYDIRQFKRLIGLLNDREQRVLQMRYQYGMTLDEIGAALDNSRERIRQIQAKAERKLRSWAYNKGCTIVTKEDYDELKDKYTNLLAEHEKLRIEYGKITSTKNVSDPKADISLINLEDMDLTVRSYNCLKRAGIDTLKGVIDFDMNQQNPPSNHNWLTIRHLGKKSLMEVAKKVFDYCGYRIQYFHDNDYDGYIPIMDGESQVVGNVEYYRGE